MRIAILGNSGSGKSTLARWFAERTGAAVLDLDTVAWEPDRIAVPRPTAVAERDVRDFCASHAAWVVEGCYGDLVRATFDFSPRLLFLDPGRSQCIAHCRSRPWEPHKYASKQEQDARLPALIEWVGEYYTRGGDLSHAGHVRCFRDFAGEKTELSRVPDLERPTAQILSWLVRQT